MTNMSYKTFTFPCNPTKIEISTQNLISTAFCPEYGPVHQLICPHQRIISGNGVFYGSGARDSYCSLEALFWEKTAGKLFVPDIGTIVAFFSELGLTEEGDGSSLHYTFRFTEHIIATNGEGTRYVH